MRVSGRLHPLTRHSRRSQWESCFVYEDANKSLALANVLSYSILRAIKEAI